MTTTFSPSAMLSAAKSLVGAPYLYGGGHSGWAPLDALYQNGVDCSGFVSAVLHAGGVALPGPQTTTGLAQDLQPGIGQDVTVYDRSNAGGNSHTIIDILGQWFESGGNTADNPKGGVSPLTQAQATAELAGGGFQALHPAGTASTVSRAPTKKSGTTSTLAQLWVNNGGSPAVANLMAAIAMAESGGRTDATNKDSNGTVDYGIWMINSIHGYNPQRLLSDPNYNAKAAVAVYESQGLGAWSTYTSGAYQAFMGTGSSSSVNYGGPNGGIVRPGGATPAPSGPDFSQAYSSYDTATRTAPDDVSFGSDLLGPFKWFWQAGPVQSWSELKAIVNAPGEVVDGIDSVAGETVKILQELPWYLLRFTEFTTGIVLMGTGLYLAARSGNGGTQSGPGRAIRTVVGATVIGREAEKAGAVRAGRREGRVEHHRLNARRETRQQLSAADARKTQSQGQNRRDSSR